MSNSSYSLNLVDSLLILERAFDRYVGPAGAGAAITSGPKSGLEKFVSLAKAFADAENGKAPGAFRVQVGNATIGNAVHPASRCELDRYRELQGDWKLSRQAGQFWEDHKEKILDQLIERQAEMGRKRAANPNS